jgi:hypothetical protein
VDATRLVGFSLAKALLLVAAILSWPRDGGIAMVTLGARLYAVTTLIAIARGGTLRALEGRRPDAYVALVSGVLALLAAALAIAEPGRPAPWVALAGAVMALAMFRIGVRHGETLATAVTDAPRVRRAPVRFAADAAEIGDDRIATFTAGVRRELAWGEVGGALARQLDDGILVDLVRQGEAPLRILSTTRLRFVDRGQAAATPREQLRRVLARCRAANPAVELEAETAAFVERNAELPRWSRDDLAAYDARYS